MNKRDCLPRLHLLFPGARPRFRGNSSSNNPNLMYQDECERRMRSVGGGSSTKDSRSSSSGSSYGRDSRDSRGGSGRDRERSSSSSSSSYRDRSSRDGGRSYGSSSSSYDQYQNNGGSQYSGTGSAGSGAVQAPPPSVGPQPLMAQQFNPPQPIMGLMGHSPFQFAPPPPPAPPGRK